MSLQTRFICDCCNREIVEDGVTINGTVHKFDENNEQGAGASAAGEEATGYEISHYHRTCLIDLIGTPKQQLHRRDVLDDFNRQIRQPYIPDPHKPVRWIGDGNRFTDEEPIMNNTTHSKGE